MDPTALTRTYTYYRFPAVSIRAGRSMALMQISGASPMIMGDAPLIHYSRFRELWKLLDGVQPLLLGGLFGLKLGLLLRIGLGGDLRVNLLELGV